jgi:Holliday junction resolvasome RuvABC endonuclease subunit
MTSISNEDLDRWEAMELWQGLVWTNPGAASRPSLGRTLALDLGAITGYAWTDRVVPDLENVGHFDLRHRKRGSLLRQADAGALLAQLPQELRQISPDVIVYEIARSRRVNLAAAENYGARLGSVLVWSWNTRIATVGVHSATLKLFATGRGNATKDEMMEAARRAFGWAGRLDDEADALWLLQLYLFALSRREG